MRRVTVALALVASLASLSGSCGGHDLPTGVAATLQDQVALIRHDAEAGRPGYALNHLNELVAMVRSRLDRDSIDQARATEILEAAAAVATKLSLLPRPSPSKAPSPSPVSEEGEAKGKDKGHEDKGHGND
jgi:hypothetical protein